MATPVKRRPKAGKTHRNAPIESRTATSNLTRILKLFDSFSVDRPFLKVEDVAAGGLHTRSTAYRYVKQLCDAGFLSRSHRGLYSLGPRIIELEHLLRETDPLYRVGAKVMSKIRREDSVLLLCSLYAHKVLCIHHEGPDSLRVGRKSITVRRSRGVPYPLFQGSGSLVLFANMSPRRIQQIYLKFAREIAENGLGTTWAEYRSNLRRIRRQGYGTSAGQITPHAMGIAVPILSPTDKQLIGSLTRVLPVESIDIEEERRVAAELMKAAAEIAAGVEQA